MKLFEKRDRRRNEWDELMESSFETGYKEGDYLLNIGNSPRQARKISIQMPEFHSRREMNVSLKPAAAIP